MKLKIIGLFLGACTLLLFTATAQAYNLCTVKSETFVQVEGVRFIQLPYTEAKALTEQALASDVCVSSMISAEQVAELSVILLSQERVLQRAEEIVYYYLRTKTAAPLKAENSQFRVVRSLPDNGGIVAIDNNFTVRVIISKRQDVVDGPIYEMVTLYNENGQEISQYKAENSLSHQEIKTRLMYLDHPHGWVCSGMVEVSGAEKKIMEVKNICDGK